MKTMLVDPTRCLQCSNCWVSCMDEHRDNDWSPVTAKQGEGQQWIRIEETEAATGEFMKLHRVPVMCQQCEDAPCMKVAKDGAVYRREDGIIIFDPVKAKGQKAIADACPYNAAFWNAELELPQKCTMCAHLLDEGRDRPRCVKACPNDAIRFVEEDELNETNLYAPIERLHPEYGTNPHVVYVRMPKVFVAGEVVAAMDDECVEDVEITMTHQITGKEYKTWTGSYGEFHLDVEEKGFYTIMFYKQGFKRKIMKDYELQQSTSLDAVKMWKTVEA